MLRRFLILPVLAYLLVCGYMYAAQDDLLFFPRPLHASHAADIRDFQVRVPRPGAVLHGWHINPGRRSLIVYYGGNAEEVSHLADDFAALPGWSALLLNYRGYGLSGGKPGEQALFEDALSVFDRLHEVLGHRPERVVLVGRSLGTGVAMHVAAGRQVDGVALITPYDSIRALSASHYPWLPVDLLLRHPFDSVGAAPGITAPVQFYLAERDFVVPHEHAERLAAALPERPPVRVLDGTGHNDIMDNAAFWPALTAFLDSLVKS